jgi:hypothetical protein
MDEEWRPVAGFEGAYEVSNLGRVRSLRGPYAGRILSPGPHPGGYLLIHLYRNGHRTARTLHSIVAAAFIGPRPEGQEVRHFDNVKTNCAASNLSYGTHAENEADKLRHGTRLRGEANHAAKLTADDARAIRARRGERQEDLAAEFGCTFSNISAIQRGKSWRHV